MSSTEPNKKFFEKVRRLEKKEWISENPLAKTSYNIAVIGLGNQGLGAAIEISKIMPEEVYPSLQSVYLVSSNQTKMADAAMQIGVIRDEKPVDIKQLNTSGLEEQINQSDICVITADATNQFYKNRFDSVEPNTSMMKEIASKFKKDYSGNIIIVTNLTDAMAYIFAQYSEVDPRRIIGLNHLDTMRFRSIINNTLMKIHHDKLSSWSELEVQNAYAIGHHQEPIPFIDGITINSTLSLERLLPPSDLFGIKESFLKLMKTRADLKLKLSDEEFKSWLDKNKQNLGAKINEEELKRLFVEDEMKSFTQKETEEAIVKTVKAIMNQESGEITASILYEPDYKEDKVGEEKTGGEKDRGEITGEGIGAGMRERIREGIYIGLPVDIKSDKIASFFEVKEGFIELLKGNEKEYETFERRVVDLQDCFKNLSEKDLIKKEPLIIPAAKLDLEEVVQKEEELIIGAGGRANKVFAWDVAGDMKFEMPSVISGKEKFASCIKLFDYEGENYLAIGTSSGVIIRSLKDKSFKRELLITDPDGEIGHIRSIEVANGALICSHYHLIPEKHTGKGIFRAELDVAMENEKSNMGGIFSGVTGKLAKQGEAGSEIILFPQEKTLMKYIPDEKRTLEAYKRNNSITAISSDGCILGDSKGFLYIFENAVKDPKIMRANFNRAAITAIEHVILEGEEKGEYIFVGDSLSYFTSFQSSANGFELKFSEPATKIDPIAKETMAEQIPSVLDIKYVQTSNSGKVFVVCGNEVSTIRLKDILSGKTENFTRQWNLDKSRSIYSIDFYKGVVDEQWRVMHRGQ